MIKLDSWHYKMSNFGNKRVWQGDTLNFCEYFWAVVRGSILYASVWAFVGAVSTWTLAVWYDIYRHFMYGKALYEYSHLWILFAFAITFLLSMFGLAVAYKEYKDKKDYENRNVVENPGFFKLTYRKWKEKTCHFVTVEDDE